MEYGLIILPRGLEELMKYLLTLLIIFSSVTLFADEFPDSAEIYLLDGDQNEFKIGEVTFSNMDNDATAVVVDIDNSVFTEHFLSMRPFRCIEGDTEWFCYLEYPYDLRSVVSKDDLSDLEYQLLFIRKAPSEFGIDAWNGLYYQLELQGDGSITGNLLEGDLNSLQSPPAEKFAKPVDLFEFIEADKSKRLFPQLRIY